MVDFLVDFVLELVIEGSIIFSSYICFADHRVGRVICYYATMVAQS
jgi:hypothetical protein